MRRGCLRTGFVLGTIEDLQRLYERSEVLRPRGTKLQHFACAPNLCRALVMLGAAVDLFSPRAFEMGLWCRSRQERTLGK